jgi:NTP pyrophosphatase (non-canonical NTP hydrolase)
MTELNNGHRPALTLAVLQAAHVERQEEWCPDQKPDLSFRGTEMAGEVGEACNVVKKLERERHGWRGSRATKEQLAEELSDVVHCAVLTAITAGIDIESAVIAKFNSTSEKNGLATLLGSDPDNPISAAPRDRPILAWWPLVKLDDYGDLTDEVVGGQWVVTDWNGGSWLEPESLNAMGQYFGDDEEYAEAPTHWRYLPERRIDE